MRAMEVSCHQGEWIETGAELFSVVVRNFHQKRWTRDSFDRFKQGSHYEMATLPQNNTPSSSAPVLVHSRFPGVLLALPNFYAGAD